MSEVYLDDDFNVIDVEDEQYVKNRIKSLTKKIEVKKEYRELEIHHLWENGMLMQEARDQYEGQLQDMVNELKDLEERV